MTLFLDRTSLPLVLCAALGALLGGCPSEIDRRAAQGLDALRACDVRGANAAFDEALAMDDRRSDIALAFALTELALLPEDPALQELAPRLGFDAPLDTTFVWGRDGLLERLARRTEDCSAIGEFVESHVPHQSLRDGGPSLVDTWDPTLTLGDVRDVLVRLAPRLARIESALVVAADGMASEGVVLEGGCGIATSPTRVRAPELLALAGGFTILRAAIQASRGYDGTIHAALLFSRGGNEEAWVAEVTPRYLRPIDGAAIAAARPLVLEGIETWIRAIDAAQAISEPDAEAIFDWSAMPAHVLADLEVMAGAVRTSLGAESPTAIPFVEPALAVDVGSFFETPFRLDDASPPIFTVVRSEGFVSIAEDWTAIEDRLAERMSVDPFEDTASFEWTLPDRWEGTGEQLGDVFDPAGRWSAAYDCE